MLELKKTICSIFMVPSLKIDRDALHANEFLNGYAKDNSREESYDDSVYLLFRPKNIDRFREFLDSEYERTKDLIEDYDLPSGFVVVVYKLDPNFKGDFDLIKQSRYSHTSPEFQALFPKTVTILVDGLKQERISLQVMIFKKTDELRKFWEDKFQADLGENVEFWKGYDEKSETLNEQKLEQYLEKEKVL